MPTYRHGTGTRAVAVQGNLQSQDKYEGQQQDAMVFAQIPLPRLLMNKAMFGVFFIIHIQSPAL
jgi:hypothetical protein